MRSGHIGNTFFCLGLLRFSIDKIFKIQCDVRSSFIVAFSKTSAIDSREGLRGKGKSEPDKDKI